MDMLNERTVGKLNIDEVTQAPLRLVKTARLLAPPAEVFAVVSDHVGTGAWFPVVESVQIDNSHAEVADGHGAIRYCTLSNGAVLTEKIVGFEPAHLFGYAVADGNAFGVQGHLALINLEAEAAGSTLLTWRQYFNHADIDLLTKEISAMLDGGIQGLIDRFGGELLKTTSVS
jgi:uncharacterized protein YndB with AHSA1/START domain